VVSDFRQPKYIFDSENFDAGLGSLGFIYIQPNVWGIEIFNAADKTDRGL
jgi:hypothetical protein